MTRRTATVAPNVEGDLIVDYTGRKPGGQLEYEDGLPKAERPEVCRAKGIVYALNPHTGLDAVILDGEVLPDWAVTD